MIKRTGEKVLTWIGFILHTLYVIFLVLIQMMVSDSDFKEQLANELQKKSRFKCFERPDNRSC